MFPGYEIISMLGVGGMGAVYRARQRSLDRDVAIKILLAAKETPPEVADRFRQEALAMARLSHPNIVQIFDYGQTPEGVFYLVMELVEGSDLNQWMNNRRVDPKDALAVGIHVLNALEFAHSRNFVHRDIKPSNIYLDCFGQIKVGDFGIAKMIQEHTDSGLTMTGYPMGTPLYMAPEQLISGKHVDARADLYSVGMMLYQMLTGEMPTGMLEKPSVHGLHPALDPPILKSVRRSPDERYQSAGDFRADLQSALTFLQTNPVALASDFEVQAPDTTPPNHGKSRTLIIATAVVICAAAAIGIAPFFMQKPEAASNQPSQVVSPTPAPLDTPDPSPFIESAETEGAISPTPNPNPSATPIETVEMVALPSPVEMPAPSPSASPTPSAATPTPPPSPPTTNPVIDLLARVRPGMDRSSGRWILENGGLRVAAANRAHYVLPYEPGDVYQFRVTFTRVTGQDSIVLFFPVGDGQMVGYEVDAWRAGLAGLQMVNGRSLEEGAESFTTRLRNGTQHVMLVSVSPTTIHLLLDGEERLAVPVAGKRFGNPPAWYYPENTRNLGIGSWNSSTIFHAIEVYEP